MGAIDVVRDFEENHGLKLEESYIQNISYRTGRLYLEMEDEIEYELPQIDKEIVTVGIGLDGTCSYVGSDGWRETMVGTISLYDKKVLVKQRLCISGARWSHLGANCMLKLRAINLTNGRWKQFWEEVS